MGWGRWSTSPVTSQLTYVSRSCMSCSRWSPAGSQTGSSCPLACSCPESRRQGAPSWCRRVLENKTKNPPDGVSHFWLSQTEKEYGIIGAQVGLHLWVIRGKQFHTDFLLVSVKRQKSCHDSLILMLRIFEEYLGHSFQYNITSVILVLFIYYYNMYIILR